MKRKLFGLLCAIVCICAMGLVGCGTTPDGNGDNGGSENPPAGIVITGITFSNKEYTYDGLEKTIFIEGTLPEGVTVAYTNNSGTNANVYNATATLSGEGYATKVLTATLTIHKATYDMSGASWNYTSPFTYDGTQKSITVSGLPAGVTVSSYTGNTATTVGNYTASVTFNYDETNYLAPSMNNCSWSIIENNPNKQNYDMSGVSWNYTSPFTYDGTQKSVTLSGLPAGITVSSYTGNTATTVGNYTASVTFNYDSENYNAPYFPDCTWAIDKATYDMSGASWNYTSPFTYDGTQKSVTLSGLPAGVTVSSYTGNTATIPNTYIASATLNYDTTNYNAPSIANCSWVIDKATITAVSLDGATIVEYDTLEHSLQVMGNVPNGASVTITYNGQAVSGVTEVGSYTVKAVITCQYYYDLTLTKTLLITSVEEQLYSVNLNGTIYFQNNLDSNKLYSYSSSLKKVNNDKPKFMMSDGTTIYYTSNGLLPSIKTIEAGKTSTLYSANASFVATDGTYLYYSVTSTFSSAEKKGIWKYKLDGSEEMPTRLTEDKGEYITVHDGFVYYSNASDGKKLYKISTNAVNGMGTLLWDEKVSYIIQDGGALYFDSNTAFASAIRKYIISSNTCIKLTTDSGKYLTKIGSYIYYINNDVLTSNFFGDGIYRVSALKDDDSSLPGTKVLKATGNGYSSLTGDGEDIYYYKLNDKHFYKYDISAETETDVMKDFVVVDETILSGFSTIKEYNGELYFANIRDNGYLYKYNPTTKACFKVLDYQVSDVYFHNGYMFFSSYFVTNFALWKMDLSTYEPEKISSDRYDKLIFDGNYVYAIKTRSAYNNYIYKIDLTKMGIEDNYEPDLLFETSLWVADFYKDGNYLYFATNAGLLGKNDYLYRYNLTDGTYYQYTFETEAFTIDNGIIYYFDHNDNTLCSYNGSSSTVLVSNVVVTDLIVHNGKLYYSSNNKTVGFYCYDLTTKQTIKISDTNADALLVYSDNIYFMQVGLTYSNDYPILSGNSNNNGNLYCYDGTRITKLA